MRRREFIAAIGAAAAWPMATRGQQGALPVIGFLGPGLPEQDRDIVGFKQGLNEAGYIEGHDVAIEYRWARGQNSRWPDLVADLVRRQVSVIFAAASTPGALAAKAATARIPIVFFVGIDPIQAGLVASLNRPGGNVTGVTNFNNSLVSKRLQLVHEAVPAATAVALLVNPTSAVLVEADMRDAETAARALGLQLHPLYASSERDFDAVFANLAQLRLGGLVIGGDALFNDSREQLAALAVRHSTPAIYQTREFVAAGGLMAYGGSRLDAFRLAGAYAARIMKGEKPADLPVQQTTKVELIINLKTAKALGLDVPLGLLVRADEVIE
jgi:putative tryptophan/tyrosine transport system substrate-binding protein